MIPLSPPTNVIEVGEVNRILEECRQEVALLCKAGCSKDALSFLLVMISKRLRFYAGPGDELKTSRKERRADAKILNKAAEVIEKLNAFQTRMADAYPGLAKNIAAHEADLAKSGIISLARLAQALRGEAKSLSNRPEATARMMGVRANQDTFDVIARSILCSYVRRATNRWYDKEVSSLLLVTRNATQAGFDGESLRKWRQTNLKRLDFFSVQIDGFMRLFHDRQSSLPK